MASRSGPLSHWSLSLCIKLTEKMRSCTQILILQQLLNLCDNLMHLKGLFPKQYLKRQRYFCTDVRDLCLFTFGSILLLNQMFSKYCSSQKKRAWTIVVMWPFLKSNPENRLQRYTFVSSSFERNLYRPVPGILLFLTFLAPARFEQAFTESKSVVINPATPRGHLVSDCCFLLFLSISYYFLLLWPLPDLNRRLQSQSLPW